MNNILEVYCNF